MTNEPQDDVELEERKGNSETVEHAATAEDMPSASKGTAPLMRSGLDDLSVWQSVRRYKKVAVIAMFAAFSASLDGYREMTSNNC